MVATGSATAMTMAMSAFVMGVRGGRYFRWPCRIRRWMLYQQVIGSNCQRSFFHIAKAVFVDSSVHQFSNGPGWSERIFPYWTVLFERYCLLQLLRGRGCDSWRKLLQRLDCIEPFYPARIQQHWMWRIWNHYWSWNNSFVGTPRIWTW